MPDCGPVLRLSEKEGSVMKKKMNGLVCGVLGLAMMLGACGGAEKEATEGAINAAQTAINLAQKQHNPLVIRRNLQLLKLYRQQKPFHMPAGH